VCVCVYLLAPSFREVEHVLAWGDIACHTRRRKFFLLLLLLDILRVSVHFRRLFLCVCVRESRRVLCGRGFLVSGCGF
jgi:hypothetical protein